MRPAHGREAVILLQDSGKPRIDLALIVSLMLDHLLLDHVVSLQDQPRAKHRLGIIKCIRDRPQLVKILE
jgi:hypothetical protein